MGADLKQIQREAKATVERYRRAGAVMSEDQAQAIEREIEQALIRAWAEQRVRQMANAQLAEPIKAIRRTIDRLAPDILRATGS